MGKRHVIYDVSDISGNDIPEGQTVNVLYRAEQKQFEASRDELAGLKRLTNVVELEFRYPDGTSESVLVSKTEAEKLITAEVLEKADSIRGRRSGVRINGND